MFTYRNIMYIFNDISVSIDLFHNINLVHKINDKRLAVVILIQLDF